MPLQAELVIFDLIALLAFPVFLLLELQSILHEQPTLRTRIQNQLIILSCSMKPNALYSAFSEIQFLCLCLQTGMVFENDNDDDNDDGHNDNDDYDNDDDDGDYDDYGNNDDDDYDNDGDDDDGDDNDSK